MPVSRIGIFDYRFAKNLAPNARFRIHHATRVNFFPNLLSVSLCPPFFLPLARSHHGSTAIQIQTSLLPARALIHTCDFERAHGCERYAWKGSWLHKECGQASPRCVGDLIRCEYMQAPPNQSLPLLHRSRSEHTRRAPADRSANFNTSLPPSRPHRMPSCVCAWPASPKPPRRVYAYGARVCVTCATETRLACGSGWIVSLVTCVCAYNDTDVFDAGGI